MFVIKALFSAYFLISLTLAAAEDDNEAQCGKYKEIKNESKEMQISEPSDFPWLGLLTYIELDSEEKTTEYNYRCTAVLISDRYLVSNAHCFFGKSDVRSVVLGKYIRGSESDCTKNESCTPKSAIYEIEEIVLHPGFRFSAKTFTHDIALIRLKIPVQFNDYIQPICLPDSSDTLAKELTHAGWNRNQTIENRILKMKSTISALSECIKLYRLTLLEWFLCATCNDFLSASPLMNLIQKNDQPHHYTLIGLSSFGISNCFEGSGDIFLTDIREYVDWIKYNMYNYIYKN